MAGFSAEWLSLREPADQASRSLALTHAVFETLPVRAPWRILDLACGTGSNLRYLTRTIGTAAAGGPRPDWLLVDHDPALLACAPAASGIDTRCLDLSTLDDPEIFAGRSLITASALLDLVSEAWLQSLAARCAEAGAAALFALNYDGRILCSPEDPDDAVVVALVNEHQKGDKGFGPAAGPDAPEIAARCFGAAGYRVLRAPSDWILAPDSRQLQQRLIEGWAQAAAEIAPARARSIDGWRDRRLSHVAAGWSTITVGHEDLGGWPSARNGAER
jgi:SAM-dependent methyltransferase